MAPPEKSRDKIPASLKRPTKKKPKDKPKRPLSAYVRNHELRFTSPFIPSDDGA
jgi:hypothetical protein